MPGRSRTVSSYSESAGALGKWKWALHICELGGGVHPFVSDEKIKDRLGVGLGQQLGRSIGGCSGPLSPQVHKYPASLTSLKL